MYIVTSVQVGSALVISDPSRVSDPKDCGVVGEKAYIGRSLHMRIRRAKVKPDPRVGLQVTGPAAVPKLAWFRQPADGKPDGV